MAAHGAENKGQQSLDKASDRQGVDITPSGSEKKQRRRDWKKLSIAGWGRNQFLNRTLTLEPQTPSNDPVVYPSVIPPDTDDSNSKLSVI